MSNFLIASIVSCMIDWIIIANQVSTKMNIVYIEWMRLNLAAYLYSKGANYYKRRCLNQVSHRDYIVNKTEHNDNHNVLCTNTYTFVLLYLKIYLINYSNLFTNLFAIYQLCVRSIIELYILCKIYYIVYQNRRNFAQFSFDFD